ncbi:MAG: transketolase, partial [Bacteroidota bacterium]
EGDSYEGMVDSHGKPISKSGASFEKTVSHLGGNPDDPFQVFPEVQELYAASMERKRQHIANKRQQQADWEAANPVEAARLKRFLSGELPELDFAGIPQKPNSATRNASAAVLSYLADQVDNMVVASADLCNSDKTEAFLKKTSHFRKGDFRGQFYQAGVSEFTMAAVATGMALHGGVIPACATFFVFSDFMKPAIRLACLMEQPVIFIWTHDAFRVGEDGPTHQPVEQEAQIRLLEQLKNHSGKSSFLALRPADANETTVAWKMALDNRSTPSGLILSRQNVPNLVDSSYDKMLAAEKGGYVVEDDGEDIDVLLLANGSEVATLAGGAALLRERKGMKIRVVSVPSEGRFMEQSEAYRQSVLPKGVPVYGLTAGLPITLRNLVGDNGKIQGLDHFGYSAPYTVLDEKFGFTAERVYDEIVSWLGR